MPVLGAFITSISPMNLLWAVVYPGATIPKSLGSDAVTARITMLVGSIFALVAYTAVVYGMHTNMKRSFMMTVRRLAGTA